VPAAVLCVLVASNISRYSDNRALQAEVASRQQFINQSIQLSRFNTQFIQLLARTAAQTNDAAIKQLLADHGITYTVTSPANGAQAAAAESAPPARPEKQP